MTTRSYPDQVNFQTPSGAWAPIDRTLEPGADGTVHPAAVDGAATIPTSLTDPVELKHDGSSLSFRLRGADGDRDVAGTTAAFSDALPGVDVKYRSRSLGLKETLVLSNKSAPSTFTYDLTGDDDLTAAIDPSGDLVMTDAAGDQKFRISAPLAWDSTSPTQYSDAIKLAVTKTSAGHWTLTMMPDATWINDAARVLPISIDPDFYWVSDSAERFHGATQDCYLSGGVQASTSYCAASTLAIGYYNRPYRPLLKFNLSPEIPANAIVTGAQYQMYLPGNTTHADVATRVHTVTSDWDNNATWNNRKTSTPWSTSGGGGDVSTAANLTGATRNINNGGYWYYWDVPLDAVRGWVAGTLPNYGFTVQADVETSASNAYSFVSTDGDQASWPALDVTWTAQDTTPPSAPTALSLGYLDPENLTATAQATPGTDPTVAHQLSSGVARTDIQYAVNGGAFSAWTQLAADNTLTISGLTSGAAVVLNARSVDQAGNISSTTSGSFTATVADQSIGAEGLANSEFAAQYGVTEAVAGAWLPKQGQGDLLRDQIGASSAASSFASMWYDNSARKIHVNTVNAAGDATIHSLASGDGIDADLIIDRTPLTFAQLQSKIRTAQQSLQDIVDAQHLALGSSMDSTTVVYTVGSSATSTEQSRIQSSAAGLGVTTQIVQDSSSTLGFDPFACDYRTDTRNAGMTSSYGSDKSTRCDKPLRGGVSISNPGPNDNLATRCTAGFTAKSSTSSNEYILTAGHCLAGHTTWYLDALSTTGGTPPPPTNLIGNVNPSQVSNNDPTFAGDAGLIPVQLTALQTPFENWIFARQDPGKTVSRTAQFNITGTTNSRATSNSYGGDFICVSGSRTGGHCGTVTAINESGFTAGTLHTCGVKTGDSGGPVYDYRLHKARGLILGTKKGHPCDLVFQSALVAENQLGVTILKTPITS